MEIKKLRLYADDIAVDVFYLRSTNFEVSHQATIILSGFPDFIGASAMTTYQLAVGNIVFQPHLRGTFDSAGEFSPVGVQESLRAVNRMVINRIGSKSPNGEVEKLPWEIDSVILVGHSFGGLLVLRYFNEINKLKHIVFTSPALHYASQFGCKEIGPEHYDEVRRKYPFTYRLAPVTEWEEILEGYEMTPRYPLGKVEKVIVLYGENDKYFDLEIVIRTVVSLIKNYIKAEEYTLQIVEKAGHPVAELLSNKSVINLLNNFCRG